MRIAIVSDEIAPDFQQAVRHGTQWGVWDYEVRELSTGRVPRITPEEAEGVDRIRREQGIRIVALSPGLFKISLRQEEKWQKELQRVLFDTFRLAERWGAQKVIVFGFARYPGEPETNRDRVIELFDRVARLGQEHGFLILVENEPNHWCDTGEHTAQILNAVNSPFLKANWDPGNAYTSGEIPFPDGYHSVQHLVYNLHIKDYRRLPDGSYECVPVGQGDIDWEGQLKAVKELDRLEYVTVETHCLPLIPNSQKSVEQVKKWLDLS